MCAASACGFTATARPARPLFILKHSKLPPLAPSAKIHGANGRFLFYTGRLWVGSHKQIKRDDPRNLWWQIAHGYDLAQRLSVHSTGVAVYGEVYGQVQDLRYGVERGAHLVLFDALDVHARTYLAHDEFVALAKRLSLPTVPLLYRGPWSDSLRSLAEGKTTMLGARHVREGFVVRPTVERIDDCVGRVILKLVGEGYLLRKE